MAFWTAVSVARTLRQQKDPFLTMMPSRQGQDGVQTRQMSESAESQE
jgi:hypothetical protein